MAASNHEIPQWKAEMIETALQSDILTFGSYKLKSNRISPYFVNCGLFCRAKLIKAISSAYASQLHAQSQVDPNFGFDVLFGPAYKGIPLAATVCDKLADIDEKKYGDVAYSFNRKEVKDHGEGGLMVGGSLKGKRCVIIDDVMTAGTAIREAISIINSQGGQLVGIIVAVDRQEKMPSESEKAGQGDDGQPRGSTIGEVRRETGVPVMAVLTLSDLIAGMRKLGREEEVKQMQAYYEQYKPSD
ncbi:orotate phosphoribosyltransferase [Hortaea werneckii]|uniref:Orotate phosphoribosyltransferase n=2 Tax=Hortaea werneckii TaxID=91943 RepID=A0A3M7CEB9_HORWE|nr:orotate phosphoribosyltransferase [Hortaea werneckii]KAI7096131.1 orotate phosphoribosyltransferase [Hortaea werneckii]KAI7159926.1 orotate phosphoribosyltransferase [Hortaea werneckii]KAI7221256.1 orotate phosphoribosyltransferase [Hortaea werneckii]KAI7234192.1 orotate phosphoribosyltransferase [Hortaea werneckii]